MTDRRETFYCNDYAEAMALSGAKILNYEQFGSYQGEWLAAVEYEGRKFFVAGSYGSCSGCDALEAEVGHCYSNIHYGGADDDDIDPCSCAASRETARRIGLGYLEDPRTADELLKYFGEHTWGDYEEIITWLQANRALVEAEA